MSKNCLDLRRGNLISRTCGRVVLDAYYIKNAGYVAM
jgi:hypothetical protein